MDTFNILCEMTAQDSILVLLTGYFSHSSACIQAKNSPEMGLD
jgi:hypothetical protein